MNNKGIEDILRGIIGEMKEQSQSQKQEKKCDCMACRITPILNDTSHYKTDEYKMHEDYKTVEKVLQMYLGDKIHSWINMHSTVTTVKLKNDKQISDALKEFEMATSIIVVIEDNIERLKGLPADKWV